MNNNLSKLTFFVTPVIEFHNVSQVIYLQYLIKKNFSIFFFFFLIRNVQERLQSCFSFSDQGIREERQPSITTRSTHNRINLDSESSISRDVQHLAEYSCCSDVSTLASETTGLTGHLCSVQLNAPAARKIQYPSKTGCKSYRINLVQ